MNNVTIYGNITKDPKVTEGTTSVCRFTVADNYGSGDKAGVNFWNVSAFGKAGETIEKYCKKGTPIIVYGSMKTNQYTDKDGNKREYTEINMNGFSFVGEGKKEEKLVPTNENPFGTN